MIDAEAMCAEFQELVQIESLSGQEETMAQAVIARLAALGLSAVRDQAGAQIGSAVGNVICTVPASDPSLPTVMLNAHLDTVMPGTNIRCERDGDTLRSHGDTILGADDKAGVTIILTALREILQRNLPHGELQIVFTVAEEIGLHGAQGLDYSLVNPRYCLVFDGGREIGTLVVAAPSAMKMTWRIKGVAAHAGVCPEKGTHAIQIMAEAVAAMKIGRIDEETTANVGLINGGSARNIVPELCEIGAEARSHDEKKLAAQVEHMRECLRQAVAKHPEATLEEDIQSSYHSFALTEADEVVQVATQAAQRLGLPVTYEKGGGGSDANVFNEKGIPSVICATGAKDPHTLTESVSITAMAKAAEWLVAMVTAE